MGPQQLKLGRGLRMVVIFGLATAGLSPVLGCKTTGTGQQAASGQASGAGETTGSAQGVSVSSWSQFQDPFEKAFTLEVPQGWTVKGGLFRLGYSDERPMVDLLSPDGAIEIRVGDVAIPTYTAPTPNHPEGSVYDLGAQAQMIVARYRTGPEYAVLYSHARFGSQCHNPQTDTADAGFTVPDYLPVGTGPSSAGQIAYRCDTTAGARVVFAYTKTAQTGALWQVPTILSFVAPPEKAAAARDIALHCVQSFRLSPAWLQYQQQMDAAGMQYQQMRQQARRAQISAQVQQFEAQMQAMRDQVKAFEAHQAAEAAQQQSFINVLRGVTPTVDPLTGQYREVWTGQYQNYWVNGLGQVVNSPNAPGAGWHQLQTFGHFRKYAGPGSLVSRSRSLG